MRAVPLILALLAAAPVTARAQPQPGSPPVNTGVPSCDQAVIAWRACIAVSPKNAQEKRQSYAEVDRFVRDVQGSRDGGRAGFVRACPGMARGYQDMMRNGACRGNTTGALDDVRRGEVPRQR
ncbi:MAG: hypothetical protein K2X11_07425 [Acetobacteraceae bacterium]|nr:hypothetical protein [Acetobacteraceae bacterium]